MAGSTTLILDIERMARERVNRDLPRIAGPAEEGGGKPRSLAR